MVQRERPQLLMILSLLKVTLIDAIFSKLVVQEVVDKFAFVTNQTVLTNIQESLNHMLMETLTLLVTVTIVALTVSVSHTIVLGLMPLT